MYFCFREGTIRRLPGSVHRLLWAQVASQVGDAAFAVLIIWAVLQMTGSKVVVGAVATLNYLPVLLFGMVGGLAADRLPRRGILIASDAARSAIALSLPLLAYWGIGGPWTLAAGGFLLFTASAFFNPARDAYIPSLVEAGDLVAANAFIQTSLPAGWLFGPALCSLFLKWVEPVPLLGGVGLLFLVSVAFLLGLPPAPAAATGGAPLWRDVFSGLVASWKDVRLRWLMVITAVDNLFIMGPAVVGTPILVRDILKAQGSAYALMEALMALGVFAGLPLTARLNKRLPQGSILIAGLALDGITYLPLYWTTSVWAAGIFIALHGLSIPMITVTRSSLIQRIAPPEQMGRIFALVSIMVLGLTAVSSGLTGLCATLVPVNAIFGAIALLATLTGLSALFSREFRRA